MWLRARTHTRLIRFVAFQQLEDSLVKCLILTQTFIFIYFFLLLSWLLGVCVCVLFVEPFCTNVNVYRHDDDVRCMCAVQQLYTCVMETKELRAHTRLQVVHFYTLSRSHYINDIVRRIICVQYTLLVQHSNSIECVVRYVLHTSIMCLVGLHIERSWAT